MPDQVMPESFATAAFPVPGAAGIFDSYAARSGVFDEMRAPDGLVRPHYETLRRELDSLGIEELRRRRQTAAQIIHEQGITYTVYGDALGMERPWQLDPVPLVISSEEWTGVETALIQRATLINRILADCYGPQDLIRTAWLAPALVFAQPDFLRPLHGVKLPQDAFLHSYAADLGRSPDGRWWVISDRTQIPTGAGYALANRIVTSRILPEAFRSCHVNRLAGFFREMQNSLAALASRRTDNPRVVLLTPGAYNETYFEQAYLARYLGYTLVEGQDLTVRDDRVFLKTIGGLEPVDVILRRVDDDFCDPLELRNDSMLGVPGLIEAVRAGHVSVANALGTGLLQSPAFKAFLPGLCRHLLGEKLLMPSVATWWCGQKAAEEYVLAHLDDLIVKPAFRPQRSGQPETLSADELRARIRFQPHLWVAQEKVQMSTAPSWDSGGIVSKRVVVRVYLVATPDGYKVMPGGLARTALSGDARLVSMQQGGASKDTWILSAKPVEETTLLHGSAREVELRRVGNNLPSRLADNFFWLGRYAERMDASARLLRSTLVRFNPERTGASMPHLMPFRQALDRHGPLSAKQPDWTQNPEALEADLLAAIFDPERADSLRQLAGRVGRMAMLVRDRTSNDVWRALSQFDECLTVPGDGRPMLAADAIPVLNRL
ncbi:MAG: circularly permuted type 2 ATP-grasp protein, partial [Chthoniobacteraceae bacterium]